jgi:C4-dicarboxylate-specific signal transduction histidine kinase
MLNEQLLKMLKRKHLNNGSNNSRKTRYQKVDNRLLPRKRKREKLITSDAVQEKDYRNWQLIIMSAFVFLLFDVAQWQTREQVARKVITKEKKKFLMTRQFIRSIHT